MTKEFVLVKDNTQESAPTNPLITYEIIADMGESGTKTVFESESYPECYTILEELKIGSIRKNSTVDITTQELEATQGLSINLVLIALDLDIFKTPSEVAAVAELQVFKAK